MLCPETHDSVSPRGSEHVSEKLTHIKKNCMTRHVREGVWISRSGREMLNAKSEWFQPPICRIKSEVVRE